MASSQIQCEYSKKMEGEENIIKLHKLSAIIQKTSKPCGLITSWNVQKPAIMFKAVGQYQPKLLQWLEINSQPSDGPKPR